MDWSFDFSRQADKFCKQQHIADETIIGIIGRARLKLDGEPVAVDLERLTDPWKGYYRVRVRKVRIIFTFDAHTGRVYIAVIDFRDNVYRRKR